MPSFSQSQLDALLKAYASGALEVRHNGKTTIFRSLHEMKLLINALQSDIASSPSGKVNVMGGVSYSPPLSS